MNRRIISCLCALAIIMSLGPATAFASEKTTSVIQPNSAQAYFDFTLARGADSSYSDYAYKNDTTPAEVYPQSGWLPSQDTAYFRVRDINRVAATLLYARHDLSSFNMSYLSGYAVPGYNYLYASAPSTNPDPYVWVGGVWYP